MLVDRQPILFYTMVALSIAIALLVAILPLPNAYQLLRPEFVCLLVIYWVISVPQHLGVTFGFLVGLVQDLGEHTIWGAHALALCIVAYISANAYQRIISYSIWHQALWICVLVGVHQVVVNWVQSLVGYHSSVSLLLLSLIHI